MNMTMSRFPSTSNRFWWWVGSAGTVGLALVIVLAGLLFLWYRQSADYPGSIFLGDHLLYKLWPVPTLRRDSAYRSTDPFNKIYGWYSVGFRLGPEAYAQSECIMMAHSFTDFGVLQREMTVTVCDTPRERLIFVMRSLAVRWR